MEPEGRPMPKGKSAVNRWVYAGHCGGAAYRASIGWAVVRLRFATIALIPLVASAVRAAGAVRCACPGRSVRAGVGLAGAQVDAGAVLAGVPLQPIPTVPAALPRVQTRHAPVFGGHHAATLVAESDAGALGQALALARGAPRAVGIPAVLGPGVAALRGVNAAFCDILAGLGFGALWNREGL